MEKKKVFSEEVLKKIIIGLMFLAGAMVSAKMILFAYTIDESFHVTMSYRKAMGESIFGEMWEVYATSSLLCGLLEKLYLSVFSSVNGMLIFLKTCGVLFQMLVSVVLFRILKRKIYYFHAAIISFCFFTMYPKLSAIPDFSNMQQWFMVLMLCALYMAYESDWEKPVYIILAALCFSLSILSYPSQLMLVPVIFVGLFFIAGKRKLSSQLYFWVTCAVSGLVFLIYLHLTAGLGNVLNNFGDIVSGDGTHLSGQNIMGDSIIGALFDNLFTIFVYIGISVVAGIAVFVIFNSTFLRNSNKTAKTLCCVGLIICISYFPSLFHWLKGDSYDSIKIYQLVIIIGAFVCLCMAKTLESGARRLLMFFLILGLAVLVAVSAVSNVPLIMNVIYLQTGMIVGLVVLAVLFSDHSKLLSATLLFVFLVGIFSTGFTLRDSPYGGNVLSTRMRIQSGLAKNTYVNNNMAWLFEKQSESFKQNINDGESVLIIANTLNLPTSSLYLMKDVIISNYSTNSTPVYTETLLTYWKKYSERDPEVIVVDKSHGTTSNFGENTWIYRYVMENYVLEKSDEFLDFYRKK